MDDKVIQGSFPDSAQKSASAFDDSLSALEDRLNTLIKAARSTPEHQTARAELAQTGSGFNAAAAPALEKIITALPDITDYSSKWVTARLIRDLAVGTDSHTKDAVHALSYMMITAPDTGTREMTAALLCDIAIAHGSDIASLVARNTSDALAKETNSSCRASLRDTLTKLAIHVEPSAYLSLQALAADLPREDDINAKTRIVYQMGDVAKEYPATAPQVTRLLEQALGNNDTAPTPTALVLRHIATTDIKFNPKNEIRALITGMTAAQRQEAIAVCAQSLAEIGSAHPVAVLEALKPLLGNDHGGRRLCAAFAISTIGSTATETQEGITNASAYLLSTALQQENVTYNRRVIFRGLEACHKNGADKKIITDALQSALHREEDIENKKVLVKMLGTMGVFTPRGATPAKNQP